MNPIFRVHGAPPPSRLEGLVAMIEATAKHHRRDVASWRWNGTGSVTDHLRSLGDDDVVHALERQALMINQRSMFALEAGRHYGVGASEYSRFSSPMREIVGIFTHKEALEALAGEGRRDEALAEQVVEAGNRGKALQSRISKQAFEVLLDEVFEADLKRDRPRHTGTVMGLTKSKIYVTLDEPPLDLKLYVTDAERAFGADLRLDDAGAALIGGAHKIRLGDRLTLRVRSKDRRRWSFDVALS